MGVDGNMFDGLEKAGIALLIMASPVILVLAIIASPVIIVYCVIHGVKKLHKKLSARKLSQKQNSVK